MLKKMVTIMECSRIFSLPMTILSWLVVFVYTVINSGNLWYGLLSFVGICFAHLGTNLIDDYFDYKFLIKRVDFDKTEYLKCSQKTKCRYLINGLMKESRLVALIISYFLIALSCGLFLWFKCGIGVAYFMFAGGLLSVLYPFLSRICMSELAVALTYGPLLFGGVYYVMTGAYSNDIFIISLPTTIMTVILLYIHTVMDYDFDINEGKCTIANRFDSQLDSLVVLKVLLVFAYLAPFLLCIFDILDWQVFIVWFTIPLAVDLYKSLELFAINSEQLPEYKWYHFPMENLNVFKERGDASFMIRMFQARNLMVYYSLLLALAIYINLTV